MRTIFSATILCGLLGLAACSGDETEPGEAAGQEAASQGGSAQAVTQSEEVAGEGNSAEETADDVTAASGSATPMEDRVATIGLLNKRNNISVDLEMKPGETREEGPVIVTLAACEQTAPWEMPQETGAFVQVDVLQRGQSEHTRVFSGWLFKRSPSLNVVEHPIYDVWVKDCAMRFPGDEA
ncbi:MAG: DUF2155 domain-containing protein [Pseudomonadota bacterium]